MSADSPEPEYPGRRVLARLSQASFVAGAMGLLLAMAVDASAVIGRHLGAPLLGSIELVQTCVVLMGSSALVGTTLRQRHASVHLVTERLSPSPRELLRRVASALSAAFFLVIALGSLIVMRDLWAGDERSELLGLPYVPLRLFFTASVLAIVVLFAIAAVSKPAPSDTHDS